MNYGLLTEEKIYELNKWDEETKRLLEDENIIFSTLCFEEVNRDELFKSSKNTLADIVAGPPPDGPFLRTRCNKNSISSNEEKSKECNCYLDEVDRENYLSQVKKFGR